MSLAKEILEKYEFDITDLTLVPSSGGRFEVSANQELLYSKMKTTRHAYPGEVLGLLDTWMEENA